MTDSELILLAGKASGDPYTEENSPLDRDDLALRLAVKLGFLIEVNYGEANQKVIVWDYTDEERRTYEYWGDTTGATCADPCAATRRAIVRAAAEIGKGMK